MNCFLVTISFLHFVVINVILGFDDLSSGKPTITEPPQNGLCGESGCHIEYTVDGDLSTCAMTEEGTPDTWYVDLLQVENIARIWINYKMPDPSETKRKVHNYQVFLSNTTHRQEGSLCIDDTGPIFPLPGVVKKLSSSCSLCHISQCNFSWICNHLQLFSNMRSKGGRL